MALFLLHSAASNHKTQSEEAKHQRVFFWFGDDLAVNPNQRALIGEKAAKAIHLASVASRSKIGDGFVDCAGAEPTHAGSGVVNQIGDAAHPYAQIVIITVVIMMHIHGANGSAAADSKRDRRTVGGVAGDDDAVR